MLGFEWSYLQDLADLADTLYREWDEPKPKGGTRRIEDPHKSLKQVQARLARILSVISPPAYLFCPVKGRGPVRNASEHVNAGDCWTLDVKSYFTSTVQAAVFDFFSKKMRIARDLSGILAKLTCVHGRLPTGAPTSPILAFYANKPMWDEVDSLCVEHGLTFTLYMDDLTVSGETIGPRVKANILNLIHQRGFKTHKFRHFRHRPAHVTGAVVYDGRVSPPFAHFKTTRQARLSLGVVRGTSDEDVLTRRRDGLLNYRKAFKPKPVS
ncbi:reverse transcriptase family protein [uncultured Maricaulis sp.]|uniref:reverse transcriptase family protein n=1 Tax=uncultured Maricaulis sp. TaxID=174710 RepID=UPI002609538B|nr:reverse transcriptase family protein [uncultured Maricaulis sp.]